MRQAIVKAELPPSPRPPPLAGGRRRGRRGLGGHPPGAAIVHGRFVGGISVTSPQMIRGFPILGENDHSQSGACHNGSRVSDWGRVALPPPRRPPVPFGGNDSPHEMDVIVRDPRASRGVPNRALVRLVSSSEHVWTCFSWLAAFPCSHMCMAFGNV